MNKPIRVALAVGLFLVMAAYGSHFARAEEDEKTPEWQWCEGDWAMQYTDAELGEVHGMVRIGSGKPTPPGRQFQVRMAIQDPRSDRVLATDGVAEFGRDGKLIVKVANYMPPSRWRLGGAGDDSGSGLPISLAIPRGAGVKAQLEGYVQHAAVIDRPPWGEITIELSPAVEGGETPIEELSGTWSYEVSAATEMSRSRAGEFDAEKKRVSGPERWRRMQPMILAVATLGQPHPSELQLMAAALDDPRSPEAEAVRDKETLAAVKKAREEHGADALGVVWLSIGGPNIPVQPRRRVEISIDDPNVVLLGPYRPNSEFPMALDVQVLLKRTLSGEPKTVRLNGVEGTWAPELEGLQPSIIGFVRRRNEGQFEPVDVVRHGEVFFVQAAYPSVPYSIRKPFLLNTDGQAEMEIDLEQVPGMPGLYRSGRLLALAPEAAAPPPESVSAMRTFGIEGEDPVVVRAPGGKELNVSPVMKEKETGEEPANEIVARIAITDAPPDSIWQRALAKARACRRKGDSKTEFTDKIYTHALVKDKLEERTISVSVEDHAAAILLREELVPALDKWLEKQNAPIPVDLSAPPEELKRQREMWDAAQTAEAEGLIELASKGGHHPLFNIRVRAEDGFPDGVFLGGALYMYDYQKDVLRREGRWDDFVAYARSVISEAKGELIGYATKSLEHARTVSDCDVRELLRMTGEGAEGIANALLPKLLRPSDPAKGESPYPAWVPDREARNHVASLHVLAEAVAAQEEYSALDTAMAMLLAAPAVVLAEPVAAYAFDSAISGAAASGWYGAAEGLWYAKQFVTIAAISGFAAVDINLVYHQARDWEKTLHDRDFGLGISGVMGDEHYLRAAEEESQKRFSLIMTGVAAGALPLVMGAGRRWVDEAFIGVVEAGRANPSLVIQDMVLRQATEQGIDSLPRSGRRIFDGMVNSARRRVEEAGGRALAHPRDRALVDLADYHNWVAAPPGAPDPFGGTTLIDIPPAEMTPAERQAFNDRRAQRAADRREGSDILDDEELPPVPAEPPVGSRSRNLTTEEIARLFEPGRNLTGEELAAKTDLYIYQEVLRERVRKARLDGMPEEELNVLIQEYFHQVQRIEEGRLQALGEHPPATDIGTGTSPPGDAGGSPRTEWPGDETAIFKPGEIPGMFSEAQRERISSYFDREHGIPPEALRNKFDEWERMGLDPDAVIAGHHFLLNGSRSNLPLPEERFRASLDRFLRASSPGRTEEQRLAAIDQFLGRRGGNGGSPPPSPPGGGGGPPSGPPESPAGVGGSDPNRTAIVDIEVPPERLPPLDLADLRATVSGVPGPGINREHLRDLQQLANDTGTPVVAIGSRQSGVRHLTGEPFQPGSDLEVGVVGDADAFQRVLNANVPSRVLDAAHAPEWRFDSEQAALEAGGLVVRPEPDTLPLPELMPPGDLPPLPPPPPPLPRPGSRGMGDSSFNPIDEPPGGSSGSPSGSRSDDIRLDSQDLRDIAGGGSPKVPGAGTIDPKAETGPPVTPALRRQGERGPFARPWKPDQQVQLGDGRVLEFEAEPINSETSGEGAFADVRRAVDHNGEPAGLLSKTYGNRRDRSGKRHVQNLKEARQMVWDTIYGDGVLRDYNRGRPVEEQIPLPEIVAARPEANPPFLIAEEVGGANLPPGVQRELVGKDSQIFQYDSNGRPVVSGSGKWRLRPEAGDATLDYWIKLIKGRIVCEDCHPGNFFWQIRAQEGKEHWTAGPIDTDRYAHWNDVGMGYKPADWIDYAREMLRDNPAAFDVYSMAPGTMIDDPRVFNLKMLEHKGYIEFNRQTGEFESGYLDIDRVREVFPDIDDYITYEGGKAGARLKPKSLGKPELKIAA